VSKNRATLKPVSHPNGYLPCGRLSMTSPDKGAGRIVTNCHYTLKTKTMTRAHLDDFVECYRPGDIDNRKQTWSEKKNSEGRWRSFTFDEIAARDKCSLDLFWLRDEAEHEYAHYHALIDAQPRAIDVEFEKAANQLKTFAAPRCKKWKQS
jgi:hypothetical protein